MSQRYRSKSRRLRPRATRLPGIWMGQHMQGALASLGRLQRNPLATLMTVAVIAIALALPSGLYVLTKNLNHLGGGWDQTVAISLFLRPEVTLEQATTLARQLTEQPELAEARAIGPDEALEELRNQSGFAEAVEQLDENPLPVVLALIPADHVNSLEALERLRGSLEALPESDFARLDTQWIQRFHAMVRLIERGVLLFGGVLGLGVLFVVGNTIRLEIENRRNEIQIMELVGATPGFIRRPFLYIGAWYGLFGGLGAWLLVSIALLLLQGPVSRLAGLYQTEFRLYGLGPTALMLLLGGSAALGLMGSWLSVNRHLAATEPT